MTAEKKVQTEAWMVWQKKKPADVVGCVWKPIMMNPLKPQQIQGWKRVEIKVETATSKLHKPQDVGIPAWQQRDIED